MARPLTYREGTFVRLPLPDGTFGYGRVVPHMYIAFHQLQTREPIEDLDVIEAQPVLFKACVRVFRADGWVKLGRRPLVGELAEPVVRFMQDVGDYRKCVMFNGAGLKRACAPEECIGLEESAVWEADGVAERLLDALLGRPNAEELESRVRLSDDWT